MSWRSPVCCLCIPCKSWNMNIYWNSFRTFFRIGLFTIGGGCAMIPLIEADVVDKNRWVSREDFLDLMAIAQSCPGIFAVNMSIFIGYKLKGVPGSVVCALGTILPSFLIILGIALFFQQFRDNETVQSILEKYENATIWPYAVGPVVGSHCGPNTVGLIFVGKEDKG